MFGDKNAFQSKSQLFKKILALMLGISFIFAAFSDGRKTEASGDQFNSKSKNFANRKQSSEIKLDFFKAETDSETIRISWKTNYESNIVGYYVWRENSGQKSRVNQHLLGGSVSKFNNGLLPAGEEYSLFDQSDAQDSYYWLEAFDVKGKKYWFGPVAVEYGTELNGSKSDFSTSSAIEAQAGNVSGQTDAVEFLPEDSNSFTGENQSVSAELSDMLAQDGNALKFRIRQDGWYRIDAGILAGYGYYSSNSAGWRLFADGQEKAMFVNPDGSIEFYGKGVDTLQTDTQIYWLVSGTTPGLRAAKVQQPFDQSAQDGWTRIIAEKRDRAFRFSSVLNGNRENWYNAFVDSAPVSQELNLSEIAFESGETATISVDMQGVSIQSHTVRVYLNGVNLGQINFNLNRRTEWSTAVPVSALIEGTNEIRLEASSSSDLSLVESVRINYPRRLKARNNTLQFAVEAGRSVKVSGFNSSAVRIFDITDESQIKELQPVSQQAADGTYTVTVSAASTSRLLKAQGGNIQALNPSGWSKNIASNLRNVQNKGELIIVAPAEFQKPLVELSSLREKEGIVTKIFLTEDIYDEFNYGVKSTEAIRDFLQYAKTNWRSKVNYVMFVGDSSFDPRNFSGSGGDSTNIVPTMFVDTWSTETVSDEALVDFNNDGIGELSVGRLPVQNSTELSRVIRKIINTPLMTQQEVNNRGVTMVSEATIGYDFAAGSRRIAQRFPSSITPQYIDRGNYDPTVVNQNIVSNVNSGPAIVNYFGHGSVAAWTNSFVFKNTDAHNLVNFDRPALMLMLACLSGDYAETNLEGLAEAAIKAENGGAFAVWAASGLNGVTEQESLGGDFYTRVFNGMRLGDAARETKSLYSSMDLRRTYILLGDPTQKIVGSVKPCRGQKCK